MIPLSGSDQVRLAISKLSSSVFTSADIKVNNASARIADMLLTGEVVVVGQMPVTKKKPTKIYKYIGIPKTPEQQKKLSSPPIKGTQLRKVQWCQTKWVESIKPNYDPLPECKSVATMLVELAHLHRSTIWSARKASSL